MLGLKKSELYSSLWSSCEELRGGMDASQYKDYALVLLFIKYISDKYPGVPYAPITIPKGASFHGMVELKGKPDIGDQISKKIIGPLIKANKQLSQSDFPDFNDANELGSGKELLPIQYATKAQHLRQRRSIPPCIQNARKCLLPTSTPPPFFREHLIKVPPFLRLGTDAFVLLNFRQDFFNANHIFLFSSAQRSGYPAPGTILL
jgi:hypothetical protein